jgi:hypothetical protein
MDLNPSAEGPAGFEEEISRYESAIFSGMPHPHMARRRRQGPIKIRDLFNRGNALARFNSRFALLITLAVGSMWCAYLFGVLAFVSLPSVLARGDLIVIVAWVAQTFLQLVLLPIIIVGQNIQAEASDKRAEQTYNDAEAVLHEAVEIQRHLSAQDARLEEIIAQLKRAYPNIAG